MADGSDHAHRAGTGHESSTLLMDEEDCGDDVNVMYATVPVWPDEEEGEDDTSNKGTKLFKVSDKTAKFLTSAVTTATPNATRRQWKDKFGAPNTTATTCPSMDKVLKSRLFAGTKSQDRQLAKHQALMLDAVGPMIKILEEAASGQLTPKLVVEAAQSALKFLGNAHSHANRERRRDALGNMNPRLTDMAEDDRIFKYAGTSLFGEGFSKKAKERDEELKCLNQAGLGGKSSRPPKTNFFQEGRPTTFAPRGRGQFFDRGRRFQRSHPYSSQPSWKPGSERLKKN